MTIGDNERLSLSPFSVHTDTEYVAKAASVCVHKPLILWKMNN